MANYTKKKKTEYTDNVMSATPRNNNVTKYNQYQSDYLNAKTPEAAALASYGMQQTQDTLSPLSSGGYWGQETKGNYNAYLNAPSFSYDPYTPNQWGGHSRYYNDALAAVQNYGPFEYDYQTDPLYSVYKKEYIREGQRASEDALAQAAAMTGGVPSSFAQTAAQQAGNYYAAKTADAIPQLRQQAYNEYNQNFANLMNKYGTAMENDQFDYNVFSDEESRRKNAYDTNLATAKYGYESDMSKLLNAYNIAADQLAADQSNWLTEQNMRVNMGDYSGVDAMYGTDLQSIYDQQKADEAAANAIYAFAEDGGEPYKIGSALGKSYINSLMPGQSVKASDGSTWTRDADTGDYIIQDVYGRTFRISSGQTPTANYIGYLPSPGDDGVTLRKGAKVSGTDKKDAERAAKDASRVAGMVDRINNMLGLIKPTTSSNGYVPMGDLNRESNYASGGRYPVDTDSVNALGLGDLSAAELAALVSDPNSGYKKTLYNGKWKIVKE